jgi:hypothetical protein
MGQVICLIHKSPYNEEIGCEYCLCEAILENQANFGNYLEQVVRDALVFGTSEED